MTDENNLKKQLHEAIVRAQIAEERASMYLLLYSRLSARFQACMDIYSCPKEKLQSKAATWIARLGF